jgi:hypothetical protein
MRRLLVSFSAVALVSGFFAAPEARAQQIVNFYVGGFTPRALDARANDDVLVSNGLFLSTLNRSRGIDIAEFNHATFGGEWLFGIGPILEGGLGLGVFQKSVPTLYTDLVNSQPACPLCSTDIEQTLKLRIVPFTATVRLVPFGRNQPIQPYIGAGVTAYRWRYSETGQFVDLQSNVFTGNFVGSGGAAGATILGGVRVPAGPAMLGFEIRHQSGKGTLPADQGFAGSTIDLGGYNYLVTFGYRF